MVFRRVLLTPTAAARGGIARAISSRRVRNQNFSVGYSLHACRVARRMIASPAPHFDEECEAGQVPWKRGSMSMPSLTADDDVDYYVEKEIDRFKPMRPRALSMKEVLEMLEPKKIAKFLSVEMLIRYAERINWIEDIPDWADCQPLADIRARHVKSFRELRLVKRSPNLDAFTEVVQKTVASQQTIQHDLALAMHTLFIDRGDSYGSAFADPWMDNFLLNCIGTETLMNQYLACVQMEQSGSSRGIFSAGIINPECDVAQVCRDVAEKVLEICEEHTGRCPMIKVEVHTGRGVPTFSYIPGFLKFIMTEVLKNSCKATVQLVKSDRELQKRPINIIVCADEHFVAIRVTDRARGIPFEVGSHVWSYLYSTTKKEEGAKYGDHATALAGFGVGLPLSRLYARYLGGSMTLVSLPGYGTSVDLFLSRVDKDQYEVVPDDDA